jgi:hypothetical protein
MPARFHPVASARPSLASSTTAELELALVRSGQDGARTPPCHDRTHSSCSSALLSAHLEGTELSCRSLGVTVSGNALEWTAARPPWTVIVLHQTNRAKNRCPHARALPSCAPPRGLVTATGDLPRTTARPSSTHLLLHMRPCGSVGTPTPFLPSSPRLAGAHARPHMVVARTSWGSRATTRDRGAHAHGALPRHLRTMCGSRTCGWSLPCVMSD